MVIVSFIAWHHLELEGWERETTLIVSTFASDLSHVREREEEQEQKEQEREEQEKERKEQQEERKDKKKKNKNSNKKNKKRTRRRREGDTEHQKERWDQVFAATSNQISNDNDQINPNIIKLPQLIKRHVVGDIIQLSTPSRPITLDGPADRTRHVPARKESQVREASLVTCSIANRTSALPLMHASSWQIAVFSTQKLVHHTIQCFELLSNFHSHDVSGGAR